MKLKSKLNLIRVLLMAFVLSYFLSSCVASSNYSCNNSNYAKKKLRYANTYRR